MYFYHYVDYFLALLLFFRALGLFFPILLVSVLTLQNLVMIFVADLRLCKLEVVGYFAFVKRHLDLRRSNFAGWQKVDNRLNWVVVILPLLFEQKDPETSK